MEPLIKFASENPTLTLLVLIATIVLLAAVLAFFFVALQQGREISLWKLTLGKPQKSQVDGAQLATPDIKTCGFQILTPREDELVDPSTPFEVTGTYEEHPEGFTPWIFTTDSRHPQTWWPQKEIDLQDNTSWSGFVFGIGASKTGKRYFGVYLVGLDGQVLANYRQKALDSVDKSNPKRRELSRLTKLTSDIYPCGTIRRVSVPLE